jgi:hypothetical protein
MRGAGTPTTHRTPRHHPRRNSSPGGRIMDNTTRATAHRAEAAEAMASASESHCRIPRPLPHHRDRAARPCAQRREPTTRRRTCEDRASKSATSEHASTHQVSRTASRSHTQPTRPGAVNPCVHAEIRPFARVRGRGNLVSGSCSWPTQL